MFLPRWSASTSQRLFLAIQRASRNGKTPHPPGSSPAHPFKTGWLPASASPSKSRSEEHTSELQSLIDLVCRLLLEKKHTRNGDTTSRDIGRVDAVTCALWHSG